MGIQSIGLLSRLSIGINRDVLIMVGGDVVSTPGFKCGFMEGIERGDLIAEKKSSPTIS
jgi:hypothetical protein